jgi:hypothetical protein
MYLNKLRVSIEDSLEKSACHIAVVHTFYDLYNILFLMRQFIEIHPMKGKLANSKVHFVTIGIADSFQFFTIQNIRRQSIDE